jgi:hypothetical protein
VGHGPLADLLLVIHQRCPPRIAGVGILGDGQLLDFRPERVSFG